MKTTKKDVPMFLHTRADVIKWYDMTLNECVRLVKEEDYSVNLAKHISGFNNVINKKLTIVLISERVILGVDDEKFKELRRYYYLKNNLKYEYRYDREAQLIAANKRRRRPIEFPKNSPKIAKIQKERLLMKKLTTTIETELILPMGAI